MLKEYYSKDKRIANRNQLNAIDLINQNLIQTDGILAFIIHHLETNKRFNFDVEIIRDTFYNVETLINESYTILHNSFKTTHLLSLIYDTEQQLAQARGTMAFLIHHLEENGKFIFDHNVLGSVLWNIETLTNKTKKSLDGVFNLNGGGSNE